MRAPATSWRHCHSESANERDGECRQLANEAVALFCGSHCFDRRAEGKFGSQDCIIAIRNFN